MPYASQAVANQFLELGDSDDISISPMKIQKLVYYAHGWYLGYFNEPLINEQVECWQYGPVIDTLFHAFKGFGAGRITKLASRSVLIKEKGKKGRVPSFRVVEIIPRIQDALNDTTEDDIDFDLSFIESIWGAYGRFSATKLSNMTHILKGPWHQIYTKFNGSPPKGTDIPREVIEKYFENLADNLVDSNEGVA